MGKKRNKEGTGGKFTHSPFGALKGITPRPVSRDTPACKKVSSDDAANESDLFSRSVGAVRPIRRDEEDTGGLTSPSGTEAPTAPAAGADNEDRLFLRTMAKIGAGTAREKSADDECLHEEEPRRSSSHRMRQIKKGTIRIAQELDLHGLAREEALRRLRQFIAGAHARGDQAVLVITGKGTNSAEGPVLPGAVSDWLRGPGRDMVAEFHPAPRDKGGSGAVVVFLRRRS